MYPHPISLSFFFTNSINIDAAVIIIIDFIVIMLITFTNSNIRYRKILLKIQEKGKTGEKVEGYL